MKPGRVRMEQWVIYDHPTDHPDAFVVRRWLIGAKDVPVAAAEIWLRPTLHDARAVIAANYPTGYRLNRAPDDDPTIIEVWI